MGKTTKRRQAIGARPGAQALTKKQIARSRKEAQQLRIIWLALAGVGVVVLAVLIFAAVRELAIVPNEPVATVNGAKVSVKDYQALLTYSRYSLHSNINYIESQLSSIDPNQQDNQFLISFYQQQAQQLQAMLDSASEATLDEVIEDELIRQKADEVGISVTREEVVSSIQDDIKSSFGSAEPANPVTSTTPISTPTPVPQDAIDSRYQTFLTNLGLSESQYQDMVARNLLRTKLQEYFAGQVISTGLVADVELIQVDTQAEADTARQRIEGGEDFAAVATDVMTTTSGTPEGGKVGWVTTGQLSTTYGIELEKAIFAASPGSLGVVQSSQKFYVYRVVDRNENGPLPADVLSARKSSALNDWLEEQKNSPEVKIERLLKPSQIPPDPFQAATTTQQ